MDFQEIINTRVNEEFVNTSIRCLEEKIIKEIQK